MKINKEFILKAFAGLLVAGIFFELGIWQLHRAQDSKLAGQVKVSSQVARLADLEVAGANQPAAATNRMVSFSGRYVKSFIAKNQSVNYGAGRKVETLEVRLMKLENNQGILVVRGISGITNQVIPDLVKVVGRLYPRQSSDVAAGDMQSLSRIDPALIAGVDNLELFDGYVVAQIEQNQIGQRIVANRIPAGVLTSKVAGFYWQHLTYVFIWWLMALLSLSAPFYNRLRDKVGI